ncbi:acyltransferase family protein [Acidocella sp.]|uniref:acyltransferase family protein n=1 Tax=Acidocella sp. TaxID=50710 RepID=UPI003D081B78
MPQRRNDIDIAKGLAILFVVFGHLVARQDPQNLHWYEPLRRAVYAFHMPFFLYLSGLVAVYSGFLNRGRASWRRAMQERALRLLLPFFGLGLLVLAGKLTAAHFLFVDNVPPDVWAGLTGLFWHSAASPALSIWYLFVLFILTMATLWFLDGQARRLPWLLVASLCLFWVPVPAYLYADRVFTYAPFFLLGAMAGFASREWDARMDRFWPFALALFLAGLTGVALWGRGDEQKILLLPLGALSMPALHGLARWLERHGIYGSLRALGRYSFMIYLGNTICIGLAKGMMLRLMPWDGAHFLFFAPALMAAGLWGPIAIKRYGFKHLPALDRMTR